MGESGRIWEAGGSVGLLCCPLQRDSGSRRLRLPGEVGLEILYQPQRTWFPNHPKTGFVLFFSPLSFFLFLSSKLSPPLAGWQLFRPTLHIRAHTPTAFPTPAPRWLLPSQQGKALRSCTRRARGQSWPAQHWRSRGTLGETWDGGWVTGKGAHPTCRALNPTPACRS